MRTSLRPAPSDARERDKPKDITGNGVEVCHGTTVDLETSVSAKTEAAATSCQHSTSRQGLCSQERRTNSVFLPTNERGKEHPQNKGAEVVDILARSRSRGSAIHTLRRWSGPSSGRGRAPYGRHLHWPKHRKDERRKQSFADTFNAIKDDIDCWIHDGTSTHRHIQIL
ncbi:hypothetical protein J1614_011048 [Plenodomus biglobosus]|nr:hypothetical protein J1614_011048 [Plenodomus biglobosus]